MWWRVGNILFLSVFCKPNIDVLSMATWYYNYEMTWEGLEVATLEHYFRTLQCLKSTQVLVKFQIVMFSDLYNGWQTGNNSAFIIRLHLLYVKLWNNPLVYFTEFSRRTQTLNQIETEGKSIIHIKKSK